MKKLLFPLFLLFCTFAQTTFGVTWQISNEPDSVYLFAYSTEKNSNTNGLHFAWSTDEKNWTSIGPEMRFLFCDYGRWGTEKKMITPFLFHSPDGTWHCIWSLNNHIGAFAHAESKDLIYWLPQTYPAVSTENNCLEPEISFNPENQSYKITWISIFNGEKKIFGVTTTDFKTYSPTKEIQLSERMNGRKQVIISGKTETGTSHKISWKLLETILDKQKLNGYRDQQWA
jgi:hypothetical protein